jgi:hypothetical protein
MNFILKRNTALGGYSLHTTYDYAYCPRNINRPCGTWCALFRLDEHRSSIVQNCADTTIYLDIEKE